MIMLSNKLKVSVAVLGVLAAIGYFLWQHFHEVQTVTGESQQQAETIEGISLAAHTAEVKMLEEQLEEAAKEIKALKNKPPETVIKTVPVEVTKTVTAEVEKCGADFAIVTNPAEPDKQVDLKEVAKLPENTTVTLNQYNVYAYKKVVRGINIIPDWSESIKQTSPKIEEISVDVSKKISNNGKYLGAVAAYNFKHSQLKAGIRLSY